MDRARRASRLGVRVTPAEKQIIDRAATLGGTSTADYVRSTMLAASKEAVREHEVIELTTEGSRVFVEALINLPEPNENLRALAGEAQRTLRERFGEGRSPSDEPIRERREVLAIEIALEATY